MAKQQATGFKSVIDFKNQRPWMAAIGFYAFHLAVGMLLGGISGMIAAFVSGAPDVETAKALGLQAGGSVALIYAAGLYLTIMIARKAWFSPWYIIALLIGLILTKVGGAVFGFIPVIFLMRSMPPSQGRDVSM